MPFNDSVTSLSPASSRLRLRLRPRRPLATRARAGVSAVLGALSLVPLLAILMSSSPTHAQHAVTLPAGSNGAFAGDGQFVISDELQFKLKKASGGPWELHLQPSIDYFIARHVSIGGVIAINASKGGGSFGFGPRAGYAIPLGDRVSFWPIVMIKGIREGGHTRTELWLEAPFLFHVVPHFFVGAGPYLMSQMSGGDYSEFGIYSLVGGYF